MTDHRNDGIRDLLGRTMSDAPEPRPWADVEQRARQHIAPPPVRRRTGHLARSCCLRGRPRGRTCARRRLRRRLEGSHRRRSDDIGRAGHHALTTTTEAPDVSEPTTVPEDDAVSDVPVSVPAEWVPLGDLNRDGLRPLATLSPVDGDCVIPTAPTDWFLPPLASISPDPGDEQPGQVFDVVTTPGSGDRPAEMIRVGVIPICALAMTRTVLPIRRNSLSHQVRRIRWTSVATRGHTTSGTPFLPCSATTSSMSLEGGTPTSVSSCSRTRRYWNSSKDCASGQQPIFQNRSRCSTKARTCRPVGLPRTPTSEPTCPGRPRAARRHRQRRTPTTRHPHTRKQRHRHPDRSPRPGRLRQS